MKVVVEKVALAWDEISLVAIRRFWRKLLPLESEVMEETSLDNNPPDSDFVEDFIGG